MVWSQLLNAAVDFVYPPCCCLCLKQIMRVTLPDHLLLKPELCPKCQQNLPAPIHDGCLKCGAPSGPYVDTTAGCIHCRGDKFAFAETYAYGVYRTEIKRICMLMKQLQHKYLTICMGELLANAAKAKIETWQPDLVISVPSRKLAFWSQHNPAPEILAAAIAKKFKLKSYTHLIKKVRSTSKQISLSPTERKQNLKQAFKVTNIKSIQQQKILLVDDTMTTGSTVHEISKELIAAGAHAVYVVVYSRGIGLNIA